MWKGTLIRAVVPVLLAIAPAASAQPTSPVPAPGDAISGEWAGAFELVGRAPFTRTLKLKLEGTRVSGSATSPGRDDGTVSGTWEKGELNLAIESERGTMALTATLKEGRLSGDWDVGHASGKWSAKRK
jgi:hypothetical protein